MLSFWQQVLIDTMAASPRISEAEWKIMKLLWRKSPQPAHDLAEALASSDGWDPRVVKTLLNRLLNKGAVSYRRYKNLYLYSPAIAEEACVDEQSASFLQRVFDGSLSMMMLHFAKRKKLSPQEIKELRAITERMER
jgi:BlaI family penicillinase repressor